jgi:hypothetical protein
LKILFKCAARETAVVTMSNILIVLSSYRDQNHRSRQNSFLVGEGAQKILCQAFKLFKTSFY